MRLENKEYGPYEASTLRRLRGFTLQTPTRQANSEHWAPAFQVVDLTSYFVSRTAPGSFDRNESAEDLKTVLTPPFFRSVPFARHWSRWLFKTLVFTVLLIPAALVFETIQPKSAVHSQPAFASISRTAKTAVSRVKRTCLDWYRSVSAFLPRR